MTVIELPEYATDQWLERKVQKSISDYAANHHRLLSERPGEHALIDNELALVLRAQVEFAAYISEHVT